MTGIGDRAFFVDLAAVVVVSAAICLFSKELALMSVLVPVVLALRLGAFLALPANERDGTRPGEVAFYALCTLLGGFNDWNSVTRHRVYDYTVPTDLEGLSHIPLWMLLFWGLILRFMVTLGHWRRLGLPPARDVVHLGWRELAGPLPKVLVELSLVLATRQAIYRTYAHPVWSWLPFALAIALYVLLLRPDRLRLALLAAVIVIGPLVEILYIQVGDLHAYRLGWLGGVPLWIALWWGLAVLVWQDIGTRLQRLFDRLAPGKT